MSENDRLSTFQESFIKALTGLKQEYQANTPTSYFGELRFAVLGEDPEQWKAELRSLYQLTSHLILSLESLGNYVTVLEDELRKFQAGR